MTRARGLFLAAVLLLCGACTAAAEEEGPAPALELTGRVVDAAGILSPEFETEMDSRLERIERETMAQVVVATTPSLEGDDINFYSLDLARAWGIGDAERNDGLMLLVAPNERRVRIEVGYGLETSVEDDEADRILREAVLPAFKAGDYEIGIRQAIEDLSAEIAAGPQKKAA